jgi:DNA primase
MVSQTKQIWHCFGCNEGGDMFSFIQKVEGLDFYETLKMLGDRAGVKIEKVSPQVADKKQRQRDILELSAKFFHKLLVEHPQSTAAREYVASRALSKETIDRFCIGYAPDTWDVLLTFLKQRGYAAPEVAEAGMAVFNQERKSYYDRFRGRVTIPLRDGNGRIVGFTARAIAKDFVGGKYINTPQTDLYDKSSVVFALNEAKQAIKEAGSVVVVEGNMDAISSHQAGVKQVVAVSGTAFTEAQIAQLKRFTETLIFSFDADAAGMLAARRGIELALRAGMNVKVLTLPYGKDPDECIRKDVELWRKCIANAQPVVDALLARALQQYERNTPEGKKHIAADVLEILRYLSNPVEKDHYVRLLADELQISSSVLYDVLNEKGTPVPVSRAPAIKPAAMVPTKKDAPKPQTSAQQEALSDILAVAIAKPELTGRFELPDDTSLPADLVTLYKSWKSFYASSINTGEIPLNNEAFLQRLDANLQTLFSRLQLYGETEYADLTIPDATQAIGARLTFLRRKQLATKLHQIQQALKEAETRQDQPAMQSLMQEFSTVSSQLATLE